MTRLLRSLLIFTFVLPPARADYYPVDLHTEYFPAPAKPQAICNEETWSAPKLQPWDPLRALAKSVTVAWMPAWHPWCEVNHYHLEARQPDKFPLRFHDLENLQHREIEMDNQSWPGDGEWTNWTLVYSGLSRAYTMDVDPNRGHAVQFRVRACGRRIKPGFDVTVEGRTGNKYEVVKEPYLGMRLHTDRDYVAADLGWFTARKGFVYIRTPMADKVVNSNSLLFTLHCSTACSVYLCYDYQATYDLHWWYEAEGWQMDYTTPRPYPRIEIMYKLFPNGGKIDIRGDDDPDSGHGVPLVFVQSAQEVGCPNPSAYSVVQTTHTVLDAAVDKINFYILGMGKNTPDYVEIRINHRVLYKRRDETGLVLAVFSRLDFSLQLLETYDTHRNRTASLQMSKDIRSFNESYFIFVASSIAWEWHATSTLAQTMEYCGAYHFGQWVHIFAEQPHYASPKSDLQQTAAQGEFGHPYVFIGVPGIGAGHGYESLMLNTGHYIPTESVLTPKAFVRGIAYYDYVARVYRISHHDLQINKNSFYIKNRPPLPETIHNPNPADKTQELHSIMLPRPFRPYVGTLQHHITTLIEANETVPPFNYAFVLYTIAGVMRIDPRPKNFWLTEYERVWSGASARFLPHNGTRIHEGLLLHERNCTSYLNWGYAEASPEGCGEDFSCLDVQSINDFTSMSSMQAGGWVFSSNNYLTFKPDKYRYDSTGQVPWTSYWGLDLPDNAYVTLKLRGKGTITISFGNCWDYSRGRVELRGSGSLAGKKWTAVCANANCEIAKTLTVDFQHDDELTFQEFDAVIVINSIDIKCWGCCQTVDFPNIIATKCNIGVTPTLCRNLSRFQIANLSTFRIIDTEPEKMLLGVR